MSPAAAGAELSTRPPAGRVSASRPVSGGAFFGVAIASFGGPLALAALYVPTTIDEVAGSAGLVTLLGSAAFAVPLLVWLRYARLIAGAGGLYDYVAAAAGRRVALVQAGLWIASYALYLVYTTVAIVYDTLPTVLPWIKPYQPALEIAIPVVLAAIMLAGRTASLAVVGALAGGQLILVGALAAVSIGRDAPAGAFAIPTPTSGFFTAGGQIALLYVCGSLPLFLGGELHRPHRTIRRRLTSAYLLVGAGVVAAVFPLAANPAFTRAPIPGMAVAQVFAGRPLAVAIGVGVAASAAGLMLVEYVALSRLLHVVTARPIRQTVVALAAVLVVSAPLTLISPERIYDDLLKPSLATLWLSQLIVFVAYPRFVARFAKLRAVDVLLALGACAFAVYGVYTTFGSAST